MTSRIEARGVAMRRKGGKRKRERAGCMQVERLGVAEEEEEKKYQNV